MYDYVFSYKTNFLVKYLFRLFFLKNKEWGYTVFSAFLCPFLLRAGFEAITPWWWVVLEGDAICTAYSLMVACFA